MFDTHAAPIVEYAVSTLRTARRGAAASAEGSTGVRMLDADMMARLRRVARAEQSARAEADRMLEVTAVSRTYAMLGAA